MGGKRIGRAKVEALLEKQKNDLDLGGSTLKGLKKNVTALTTAGTTSLTEANSGTVFTVSNAAAQTILLPTPKEGLEYMFVLTAAGSEDVTIKSTTNGATLEDLMQVILFNHTDAPVLKDNMGIITFKDDTATAGALVRLTCVGSGVADGDASWWGEAYCDANGGVTVTAND